MFLEINTSESEKLSNTQHIDFNFDIYDLHNEECRINTLESLLCYLVKEGKPIDNCLTALNYLESKPVAKSYEKPKQSIPRMIAEAAYNIFAIVGALAIISCMYKSLNTYSNYGNIPSEQGVIRQSN
ncbi:MAG: hypothetical protein AAF378_00745 [Cyanobacteria bacterium P01_A01_bin.84]